MKLSWGLVAALGLLAFSTLTFSYALGLRLNQIAEDNRPKPWVFTQEQFDAERAKWHAEPSR